MSSVLPPGWAETKLENLVEILDRKRVPVNAKERAERLTAAKTTYPYYGATGQVGEIDDFIFEGESVLLGEDGVPFFDPYKPKAYLVSGRYWVNNHAHVLRGNGAVNNRFLTHQLNVVDYRQYVSGTTRLKLTQASMKDLPLRVPPIREQERIVEKIETLFAELDKGEESLRQVQTLLARYRQSVLKAAVTGELTADWRAERAGKLEHGRDLLERILQTRRETWEGRGRYKQPVQPADELPSLPQGWVWATVDQVVAVFRNGLSKKPGSEPSRFPILRISATRPLSVDIADVRYYPASDDSEVAASWVEKGDLLFTRYSGSTHFVGVCGQMRGDEPVLHPDKLIKARAIDMDGLDIDFLEIAWNAGETRRHIASKIKTTSGQQGVAGADIKAAPFPLPPPEEQGLISRLVWEALDRVRELQSHCEAELARSSALRQSILKDAFSGRLVPQDAHDEPASELLARIHRSQEAGRAAKR